MPSFCFPISQMNAKFVLSSAVLLIASLALPQSKASELRADFSDPGNEARPRAYWTWLNGDVTQAGLTRDLEEAKAKGMGGFEMWDCEAMRNPGRLCAGRSALSRSGVGRADPAQHPRGGAAGSRARHDHFERLERGRSVGAAGICQQESFCRRNRAGRPRRN